MVRFRHCVGIPADLQSFRMDKSGFDATGKEGKQHGGLYPDWKP